MQEIIEELRRVAALETAAFSDEGPVPVIETSEEEAAADAYRQAAYNLGHADLLRAVEELQGRATPQPASDELVASIEQLVDAANSAYETFDRSNGNGALLEASDVADMNLGQEVLMNWPALLARLRRTEATPSPSGTATLEGEGAGETFGKGKQLIQAERLRQIQVEGYTYSHDDEHSPLELEAAGEYYRALPESRPFMNWPWGMEYFKPTPNNRVRELVKAGALFQALSDWHSRTDAVLCIGEMEADKKVEAVAQSIDALLAAAPASGQPVGGGAGEWVAVSERLPSAGQTTIVHTIHGYVVPADFFNGPNEPYWSWLGEPALINLDEATHWQPLPQAPAAPSQKGGQDAA